MLVGERTVAESDTPTAGPNADLAGCALECRHRGLGLIAVQLHVEPEATLHALMQVEDRLETECAHLFRAPHGARLLTEDTDGDASGILSAAHQTGILDAAYFQLRQRALLLGCAAEIANINPVAVFDATLDGTVTGCDSAHSQRRGGPLCSGLIGKWTQRTAALRGSEGVSRMGC